MLVIRLLRTGKKNQPSFKIVVTDKKNPPRGGRFVESVGFYNPLTKEKVLKADRIKYWLSVGAKPSDTVYNLLVREKVIEGGKIPVHKKSKKKGGETPVPEAIPESVAPGKSVEEKIIEAEKSEETSKEEKQKDEPEEKIKKEEPKEASEEQKQDQKTE